MDPSFLTGKHTACPICGGKDRFRFTDWHSKGAFICNQCGSGDGFDLLRLAFGLCFRDAAELIRSKSGNVPLRKLSILPQERQQAVQKQAGMISLITRQSREVIIGDPVDLYLKNRTGIQTIPRCIYFHHSLVYRHEANLITRHPAMIATVTDGNGHPVAIHRTYLTACGGKATVPEPKKVLGRLPVSSAVRLFNPGASMGIAEGIETALSASLMFNIPTWAAISASGLERWTPPQETTNVTIFGDNDIGGTGQKSALKLANKLVALGVDVDVKIPGQPGSDWNDVLVTSWCTS